MEGGGVPLHVVDPVSTSTSGARHWGRAVAGRHGIGTGLEACWTHRPRAEWSLILADPGPGLEKIQQFGLFISPTAKGSEETGLRVRLNRQQETGIMSLYSWSTYRTRWT